MPTLRLPPLSDDAAAHFELITGRTSPEFDPKGFSADQLENLLVVLEAEIDVLRLKPLESLPSPHSGETTGDRISRLSEIAAELTRLLDTSDRRDG